MKPNMPQMYRGQLSGYESVQTPPTDPNQLRFPGNPYSKAGQQSTFKYWFSLNDFMLDTHIFLTVFYI
jgi:hypothetical protein